MEVLTEMDEYFNAMSKIDMDESVMPYVKGRLVESDTYNKVQKILNTPELEKAHMYCYDLDLENLEECDVMKINNLYKLGVDRGFIDDDLQYQDCEPADCGVDGPKPEDPVVEPTQAQTNPRAKIPCFVAMYSAMKDGQIKTGEAYSHAISVQAAKADVIAQLSRFGYTNISILAVEATEEDACACSLSAKDDVGSEVALGEDDYLKGRVHNGHVDEGEAFDEDDMLDGRFHNHHIPEAEEDDAADGEDTADDSSAEEDSGSEDSEDDSDDSDVNFDLDGDDSADGDKDDDSSTDDATKDSEDSSSDEDSEDSEDASTDSGDSDDDSDDDPDDDSNDSDGDSDDDQPDDDKEELDDNKKADLKDNYKKAFKNIMLKCKFEDRAFDDLTLKEKVKFFTELSKAWKEDYEPSDFMSDKEVD